jgi:phosphotransferase system  glucose/maltose/N-acetylglucosamine-specific IIC component
LLWDLLVIVSYFVLVFGIGKTVYFEPTTEALETAIVGKRYIIAGSIAFVIFAMMPLVKIPTWTRVLVAVPALFGVGIFIALPALFLLALPIGFVGWIVATALAGQRIQHLEPSGSATTSTGTPE